MPTFIPRRRAHASWIASALLLVLIVGSARAQGTGRSLDIQPGARQNGLGAAGVALFGTGSGGLWWNPALLGFAERVDIQGTYAKLVPGLADNVNYYHVTAAAPVGRVAIGAGYTQLNYGFFDSRERSAALTVATRVLPWMSVGATVKRIHIEPSGPFGSGSTNGYDLGGALRIPVDWLTVGFGVNYQNFGGDVRFAGEDEGDPLSENLKIGGSIAGRTEVSSQITLGWVAIVDYNASQIVEDFDTWHGGLELSYGYRDRVAVAARVGHYYDELGQIEDTTIGCGARVEFFSLDGAWIPQAMDSGLPRVFKISAGLDFTLPAR